MRFFGLALLTLSLTSASAADREWNSYQPGNNACFIRLPANPEYQTQIVDTTVTHIYVAKDTTKTPPFVYSISFGDYPKEKFTDKDSEKKILDSDRDGFVKAVGGKILSEKIISKDSFNGRAIEISAESTQARYFFREYLADTRIFHLAVCVPAAKADDPDIAKFFDSFQLPKK